MATVCDLMDEMVGAVDGIVPATENVSDWREDPVSLDTFVTSPEHLGLPPLYACQRKAMVKLFGTDPKLVFADPLTLPEKARRLYQTAVLLWGKGSGKDYLCSIVVCWCVHILLCLRDPQAYLELAPGENIDIINVAYNADQAKKVFFSKLKARVERWKWLNDRFNVIEAGRRKGTYIPGREEVVINDDHIAFPRIIRAWSRHAQNESYEGLNIIVWIMDEASAFLSKLKRENAEAIHSTLKTSAGSRFGLRWLGFVISFPRHADDFTMTKLKEAKLRPELGVMADGPRRTWEVNERTRHEPRVRVRDLEVPLSLANDFESDFEDSLSKYCCEPPMAREAFFRFPQHLRDAVKKGRPPLISWEQTLIPREDGESGEVRQYVGVRLLDCRPLPKGAKLYAHGDPGLVNDSFALGIGHPAAATVIRHVPASEVLPAATIGQLLAEGKIASAEEPIEWEVDVNRTIVDALIVWRPDPRHGHQVDLQNVEDTIFQLKAKYPSLGHWPRKIPGESTKRPTITFDHWNAALTIQRMRSRRLNVAEEHWARDFQVDIYRNARSQFYNNLVELPDTPSITSQDPQQPGAVYELERIEFVDAVKVDHPEGGSKDEGDAIVRLVQHCTEHNRAGFAYATSYGHKRLYDKHGPMIPSEIKPTDPTKSPGTSEALREADRQSRRERPLGELVPAEGTVDGRRLTYTSVSGRSR